jgi:transposase
MARDKKKARRDKAWIFFQDESGVSQLPCVRRTWAPKGETPVLTHSFNWEKLSVSGALGYHWNGKVSDLFFHVLEGSYDTDALIVFLDHLKAHRKGRKTILIWDRLPAHKSVTMVAYLKSQRDWLSIKFLPAYCPELNPLEYVWGNIKGQELANRCAYSLAECEKAVAQGMARIANSPTLAAAFLHHAGLFF